MTNRKNDKSKSGKRLAILLIAILLIALIGIGAYTYSRYVSSQQAGGSARVAKWGFSVAITGDDMDGFSAMYDTNSTATAGTANAVIKSAGEDNVVAPNSKGGVGINLTGGTAEVNAEVVVGMDNVQDVYVTFTRNESTETFTYYPIKWTYNTTQYDNLAAVDTAIGDTTTQYAAGATVDSASYSLSWEWAFENAAVSTGYNSTTVSANALDTVLGNMAAAGSYTLGDYTVTDSDGNVWTATAANLTVGFSLTVTIQQINTTVSGQGG